MYTYVLVCALLEGFGGVWLHFTYCAEPCEPRAMVVLVRTVLEKCCATSLGVSHSLALMICRVQLKSQAAANAVNY